MDPSRLSAVSDNPVGQAALMVCAAVTDALASSSRLWLPTISHEPMPAKPRIIIAHVQLSLPEQNHEAHRGSPVARACTIRRAGGLEP
jgi:hypothetical protein